MKFREHTLYRGIIMGRGIHMGGYIDELRPDESGWRKLDCGERIMLEEFTTPAEFKL
jgi:hypothetical protein